MSKTVVGLFSTFAQAQQVKQTLVSSGFESQNVTVVANDDNEMSSIGSTGIAGSGSSLGSGISTGTAGTGMTGSGVAGAAKGAAEGMGEKIGNFFRNLTGGDEETHSHYASGVNQGGALVAVTVADERANEVASLLKQHGAREIEGGSQTSSSSSSYTGASALGGSAALGATRGSIAETGQTAIPIIEEQLVVGKREVDRGGVRVYSHVTERPVEADVTLRDERINVERRPVNRAATAADFQSGSGSVIEMKAMGEEAVVGKSSRVVEEVLVGKQSSERVEEIHDTVRKTEVEVENLTGVGKGINTGTSATSTSVDALDKLTNKKNNY